MQFEKPTSIPIFDFGGSGPTINLAVANGFPPGTYAPLIEPLTSKYHVVSVQPRALWNDPPDPEVLSSWYMLADDLLAGLKEHNLTDVISIGHSMGGVAAMLAAIAEPSRFRALILLDPTLLSPPVVNMLYFLRIIGQMNRFPLARGALKRRNHFDSVDTAFAYWRRKQLFKMWSDEALRIYAECMTQPSSDGNGLELVWPPAWESQYFKTVLLDWPREVKKLRDLMPILAIQGSRTNTFTNSSAGIFRRLVPNAAVRKIKNHGHLFPMTAPEEVRNLITEWLAELPVKNKG